MIEKGQWKQSLVFKRRSAESIILEICFKKLYELKVKKQPEDEMKKYHQLSSWEVKASSAPPGRLKVWPIVLFLLYCP